MPPNLNPADSARVRVSALVGAQQETDSQEVFGETRDVPYADSGGEYDSRHIAASTFPLPSIVTPHQFIREKPGTIVLAASLFAADDLVREACQSALLGIQRHTFRSLVYALSTELLNARGLSPLRRIAREAIAATVARGVNLRYLKDVAAFPGFPCVLASTLQDLRLNRISISKLRETGRSGSDLAELLVAYKEALEQRDLADYPLLVELAIEQARNDQPAAVVLLDLNLYTTAERELRDVLLNRAPSHLVVGRSEPPLQPASCLEAVRRFALSGDRSPERQTDDTVDFISASSESLEFVEIARRILREGVPFDQTAILLRNPQRQGPLVREALGRAEIPAYYVGGTEHPDVGGRAFLTLLRCREEGYSAAIFGEYLALGQVPHEDGDSIPSTLWERLLREAAVIEGLPRWRSRLAARSDRLYAEYEKETNSDRRQRLARDIAAHEKLAEFASDLIERLARLPVGSNWGEWLRALEDLATAALNWPRTVVEALEELAPLADLGPVSLSEVIHTLEQLVANYREDAQSTRYGKVFVSNIDQAQGMKFRLVFVPGLNEGMFPRPPHEDPLLLDDQRQSLGMATAIEDTELLRSAVACAEDRAVFSYSRVDLGTGRERVPSFFAVELLKAAYGSSADIPKLLERIKSSSESRIGWSAPNDPANSIDNIEFDLSSFRAAAAAKAPGGYSWIKVVSPHAARAIEARILRWGTDWSRYDGLSRTTVHVDLALQKYRLAAHPWSASALQQFARCPFRFYLHGIHGLRPVEEPEALERMDGLIRGRLYHRVLFHLFQGGDDNAISRLDEILPRLAGEVADEHAPVIPGLWSIEVEKLRVDLRTWLADRDPEWSAAHVELAFGTDDLTEHDPASVIDPVTIFGSYLLRGSIDLVERNVDGRIRITDHKTGQFPRSRPKTVGNGEVLQPVLYALALEAMRGETPAASILSYGTLKGGYRTAEVPINDDGRDRLRRVLSVIDEWINKGFLPTAPKRGGCERCEYLPACGPYEEMRISGKPQPELRELVEIRRLA